MQILTYDFFCRDTALVAKELLGKIFVFENPEGFLQGRIVETEAYLGKGDPACHTSRGKTPKNSAMFGTAGRHYLYRSYGIHICYNVTTDEPDMPSAVLLRALEPLGSTEHICSRRPNVKLAKIASGPGNLCKAFGLNMSMNDTSALRPPLYYTDDGFRPKKIITTTRVGITQGVEMPLRFYIAGHPSVSRK